MTKRRHLQTIPKDPAEAAKLVASGILGEEVDTALLADPEIYKASLDIVLGRARDTAKEELGNLDDFYEHGAKARFGSVDMTAFGLDPSLIGQMDERNLELHLTRADQTIRGTQSPLARQQMEEARKDLQKALDNLRKSQGVVKGILTGDKDENPTKGAPAPDKHKGVTVNAKGKKAYTYDKKHGGKGPGKQPKSKKGLPAAGGDDAPAQDPTVTPPPPVDPKPLADKIGVTVETLKTLAEAKTRDQFVALFGNFKGAMKELNLTAPFLSSLYDALTAPPKPPPGKAPPGAPAPKSAMAPQAGQPGAKVPPAASKAILHFVGDSGDPDTRLLLKALRDNAVHSVTQMQNMVASHFAVAPEEAVHLTHTLLRQWEADAVVNLQV